MQRNRGDEWLRINVTLPGLINVQSIFYQSDHNKSIPYKLQHDDIYIQGKATFIRSDYIYIIYNATLYIKIYNVALYIIYI